MNGRFVLTANYQLTYPDRRKISANELVQWALDVLAREDNSPPYNMCAQEAMNVLEGRRLASFGNSRNPVRNIYA